MHKFMTTRVLMYLLYTLKGSQQCLALLFIYRQNSMSGTGVMILVYRHLLIILLLVFIHSSSLALFFKYN